MTGWTQSTLPARRLLRLSRWIRLSPWTLRLNLTTVSEDTNAFEDTNASQLFLWTLGLNATGLSEDTNASENTIVPEDTLFLWTLRPNLTLRRTSKKNRHQRPSGRPVLSRYCQPSVPITLAGPRLGRERFQVVVLESAADLPIDTWSLTGRDMSRKYTPGNDTPERDSL